MLHSLRALSRRFSRGKSAAGPLPVGRVNFGDLRRLSPVSRGFGFERGDPVDRYYISKFLEAHRDDIRGVVLDVADTTYACRYGGQNVQKIEVLHVAEGSPDATIIGDLATGMGVPHEAFDCMILTQTLQFVYDIHGAVTTTWNALKPSGVLLATVAGISQISRYDMDRWGEYWRMTEASARRMFGDIFGAEHVSVEVFGNVLASCAFLHGVSAQELTPAELDATDNDYQMLIGIRAMKRARA